MSLVTLNNRALKDATAVGTTTGLGNLVFISRSTASSSSSLSITSNINSTYKEYIFFFNNMHPATNDTSFNVNFSIDGGSNYNVTKTTTYFRSVHDEADSYTAVAYETGRDLAQGTGYQNLSSGIDADDDGSVSGYLHLFDPSNTTSVKHFISVTNAMVHSSYTMQDFCAGYGNTTSAINAIDFKMTSGNIDSGTIDLYGVN
jgi:hypothetical protein